MLLKPEGWGGNSVRYCLPRQAFDATTMRPYITLVTILLLAFANDLALNRDISITLLALIRTA